MENSFNYNSIPVRVITDNDEQTWFVGVDVCEILEYSNSTQAIEKLDDDEKKLDSVFHSSGQARKTWTINESGLYSLILRSTKPEAKAFRKWVTSVVLPSIRKAGKFTTDDVKKHEIELQAVAAKIESLREEKETHQKKVNELKREIDKRGYELLELIKMDRSQLKIEFP